jgi:cytidyltransferase-like protein
VKIGILSGGFNPVTRAHVALADAARSVVDQVIAVLPRTYPHKELHGATLDQRVEMLEATHAFDRVQLTYGGLFLEIAEELAAPGRELYFICGRDAAERVLTWPYEDPHAVERMLRQFRLLVASRAGNIDPHADHAHAIVPLPVDDDVDAISSTEARRRIAEGEHWEPLVPQSIHDLVRAIYLK